VNRQQQLSLVLVLGLISSIPAFAAGPSEQGGGWRTSSEDNASSTLSGKLYRNSADQDGSAPYIVLDRWGVVRGYVAAARGVELESCLGQQVSLQGTIKTLPGGDMPYMTCQRVLGGNTEMTSPRVQRASAAPRRESFVPVAQDQRSQGIALRSELPTRGDMSADPTPRTATLPLREVVLEPQALPADDDSQDRPSAQSARRADPGHPLAGRRRPSAVQAANYQVETVPTPTPAGEVHRSLRASEPVLEPSPMEEGAMVAEGPMVGHGRAGCDACDEGDCGSGCSEGCNNVCADEPGWGSRRPLFCWGPSGIWVKADYLQWWERGTHVPALVTTGTSTSYLGGPGTQVLFGDEYINNKSESGGRIQAGLWLNPCETIGFEGEFLALGDEKTNYNTWSDGNPIVSRPYFDTSTGLEMVERIAYPRGSAVSFDGSIDIYARTSFQAAGAHFLFTTCRQDGCWTDDCTCKTYHDRFRADFVAGYRYLDLEDRLGISEMLTSTATPPATADNPNAGSAFLIHDQFNTQNTFNGADLGMKFEFQRNRWSLDLFPRVALGSTHSTVSISGSTRVTDPTGLEYYPLYSGGQSSQPVQNGGLLAQPSNIGTYSQNNFAVVPELDLKVGYQFTTHTRILLGYDCIYWSSVARAGEQIDRSVNGSTLPGSNVAQTGATAPLFSFQQTGFWAQGINVGVDCRW
jgi:hypothetical protein